MATVGSYDAWKCTPLADDEPAPEEDDCECGNPIDPGQTQCRACRIEDDEADHGDFLADMESDLGGES